MDVLTRCSYAEQKAADKHMPKVLNRRPQKKLFKPDSPNSCSIEGCSGETPFLFNSALSFERIREVSPLYSTNGLENAFLLTLYII